MKLNNQTTVQAGASLLEVLVALLIISVGLLGIAKTQALSLGNTKTASSRSIAAIQAASMASAMHANKFYWAGGLAPAIVSITGSTGGPSASTVSDATLSGKSTDCLSASCDPSEMAAYDLRFWGSYMAQQLPAGAGSVQCTTIVDLVNCTIQVQWTEKYISLNQSTNGAQQTATQILTLLVQP